MTIHLRKLSVGSESVESMAEWQAFRLQQTGKLRHVTRSTPARRDEVLNGGSIYWIIKGVMLARQRIIDLEELIDDEGVKRCAIVIDPEIVRVMPRKHRPFQGWRYLKPEEAPADIDMKAHDDIAEMPTELLTELKELGLL
ncbi:DUF1489 family protein [Alphaproteobacteria bacterium HT1-32]|nr:DUF1489 family protein [Alphaproteobacteria bacterium HT1-32]